MEKNIFQTKPVILNNQLQIHTFSVLMNCATSVYLELQKVWMSKGEFTTVAQVNGGIMNMVDWEGKDQDTLALIKYIADKQ